MITLSWWQLAILIGSVVLTTLAAIFKHLEQIDIAASRIYQLFSWVGRRIRLKAINTDIQGRINVGAEAVEAEVQGVMPHPIKIEWVRGEKEYSILQDGEVVVRLRNEFHNARNIVTATMLYLSSGFLRESRPYVDPSILQALDLHMAWRLLRPGEESEIMHYFLNEVYSPVVRGQEEVEVCHNELKNLEAGGTLTRVYVRELRGVGRKARGFLPSSELKRETRKFVDFLNTIEAAGRGEMYPLNFLGKTIRVGVQLVARLETVAKYGLRLHQRWLRKKVQMGVETTYVKAIGSENIDLARHLAQWGQNEGLVEIVRRHKFFMPTRSGTPRQAVILTCHSAKAKADVILSPEEEVEAALVRHVPSIALGRVEVLDVAREKGYHSKVVVRSAIGAENPIPSCVGENGEYVRQLVVELQEPVWFIPWVDDPESFLLSCLGISADKVHSVSIDRRRETAEVVVEDVRTAKMAVGRQGSNVKLAREITGLRTQILMSGDLNEPYSGGMASSPEEALRQALTQQIPEIAAGAIEVVDCIREPGVRSKVVVRDVSGAGDPVPACLGADIEHLRALGAQLDEHIWFVRWGNDLDRFLIDCLEIEPSDLVSVRIDERLTRADVLVADRETCSRAIGTKGINVRQSEELTGLSVRISYEAQVEQR